MRWDEIIMIPEGPERIQALVVWIQSFFPEGEAPVLVGGSAVEVYTNGTYTSGDIDCVGYPSLRLLRALRSSGFVQMGKQWVQEEEQVFLEFPSGSLIDEEATSYMTRFGPIRILSLEDLIVDRLASLVFWGSQEDGANAAVLYTRYRSKLNLLRLRNQARKADVTWALQELETHLKSPTRRSFSLFLNQVKRGKP